MTAIVGRTAPADHLGHPDPVARDLALAVVESGLATDPRVLASRLRAYYAPDGAACGASFLDGTEHCAPNTVTAADLFAVTLLGIPVPPSAARRLLHDTPQSARVAACLEKLPLDVTLAEAGPGLIRAMADLHDTVAAAVDTGPRTAEAGSVLASAVCARKRPELFPVLDREFCAALALAGAAAPVPSWSVLRSVLRWPHVREGLEAAFALARADAAGLPVDVYPLRRLHVLIRHVRAESAGTAGRG